ncbi:MAG TPA: MoaD/ThiS family protein [Gemmataceae bacterium]
MTVTVRLFARARDLAGAESVSLDLPGPATVADLRRGLARSHPALGEFLPRCAVSVNGEFAADADAVPAGAEVAVLPPVSGG